MTSKRTETRRAGFTLVELLVAITLVLIFGAMAAALMRQGTAMWRSGHRRSYAYDTAAAVFQQLDRDLGAARSQFWTTDVESYDPRVQFHVDRVDYTLDYEPAGITRGQQQRLRFVRAIPEDTLNPRLRQAGDGLNNDNDFADTNDDGTLAPPDGPRVDEEYYNQKDDPQDDLEDHSVSPPVPGPDGYLDYSDGLIDEDLMPLEGMCEVAYLMGLAPADQHTLYRGVLAPIGETVPVPTQSGFRPEGWNVTLFEDDYLQHAAEVQAKAVALTENVVLHFELRLWSQYTTTWDAAVPWGPWNESWEPEPCGPKFDWNSDGDMPNVWQDNIFPRALMAVVVIEPPERLRAPGGMRLREDIDAHDLQIPITGTLPAYNARWPYLLLRNPEGEEWVRFQTFDEAEQRFLLNPFDPLGTRGRRGTWARSHPAGTEVLLGYTLSSVFHNPTGREFWGEAP